MLQAEQAEVVDQAADSAPGNEHAMGCVQYVVECIEKVSTVFDLLQLAVTARAGLPRKIWRRRHNVHVLMRNPRWLS